MNFVTFVITWLNIDFSLVVLFQILFEGKRAVGVRFIRPGGYSYEVFANKEVILSAGAINSPHLLLLSGVGPKEELEKHQVRESNRDSW